MNYESGFVVERYKRDNSYYIWGVRNRHNERDWKSYAYVSLEPSVVFRYVALRLEGKQHKEVCKILWKEQKTAEFLKLRKSG